MSENAILAHRFAAANAALPLVAILRGIEPIDAEAIGRGLYEIGFRLIEVPLNSPDPFTSIATIRRALPEDALVGAGTVMTLAQVDELKARSADLVVMPHTDVELISYAKTQGLIAVPGVTTPSEAFAALKAGADALKLFPAEVVTPPVLKAMATVLPKTTRLLPVGGITPQTMTPYVVAGASGFGLGSALYKPGMRCAEVVAKGREFVAAWGGLPRSAS